VVRAVPATVGNGSSRRGRGSSGRGGRRAVSSAGSGAAAAATETCVDERTRTSIR